MTTVAIIIAIFHSALLPLLLSSPLQLPNASVEAWAQGFTSRDPGEAALRVLLRIWELVIG